MLDRAPAGKNAPPAIRSDTRRWLAASLSLPYVGASVVLTLLVLAAGLMFPRSESPGAASDEGLHCRHVTVTQTTSVAGAGHLCSGDDQIQAGLTVSNLTPGTVYTTWLAYFDEPSACAEKPCGMADMVGLDPQGVAARMDGLIAAETGNETFTATFRGVHLSNQSQVSLLLVSHGATASLDKRARYLRVRGPYWLRGVPGSRLNDDNAGTVVAIAVFTGN